MALFGALPHMRNELRANSLVSELLLARRPAAVIRGVVLVSVDAIERMFLSWSRAHVLKEGFKTIAPALTYRNATSAIKFVRDVLWERAATNHAVPNLVLGSRLSSSANSDGHAVRFRGASTFLSKASAAFSVARSQIGNGSNNLRSAVAFAKIATDCATAILSDFWCSFRNRNQPAEALVSAINRGRHS